ncbi:alpha/beta hydrolase [Rubricoccus marinus]|uniref:Esterase n=1 Tax=Rubricoccus marinus TaxID=716817 RepID=A0A259U1Y1_9BACT|nr:alpha/beta hydrolase-fold protein [Rubricoccus marinus]OZC03946.1 hypothetical protein BSZ36_13720 [Rubricoccus marinus]
MRLALVILALVATSARAQTEPAGSAPEPLAIPGAETFTLDAPAQTYRIHVTLPEGYRETGAPHAVLYYADAWWLTEAVAGIRRLADLAESTDIEPVILVGIGMDGEPRAWNAQRNRDLTPSPTQFAGGGGFPIGGVIMDSTNTGGAPAFLRFIQDRLAPRIEAHYNASATRRGWLGHSLGGLFGAWAAQARPDAFERLLLISPSAWWNNGEVVEAGFTAPEAQDARVFLAYGIEEGNLLRTWAPPLADAMEAGGFPVTRRVYEGAGHHSILPQAIWDGLVALYGEAE